VEVLEAIRTVYAHKVENRIGKEDAGSFFGQAYGWSTHGE
jgi:hypothetical protein